MERCRAPLCNSYPKFPVEGPALCVCTAFVVVLWSHALEDSFAVAETSFFFLITAQPGPAKDHCAWVLWIPTMELLSGEQWLKFLTVPCRFRGRADKKRQQSYSGFAILHPVAFPLATPLGVLVCACLCMSPVCVVAAPSGTKGVGLKDWRGEEKAYFILSVGTEREVTLFF